MAPFTLMLAMLGLAPADPPAPAPPPTRAAADAAGNRLEAFPVRGAAPAEGSDRAELETARHCAGRNWCAWARRESVQQVWQLFVWHNPRPDTPADPIPRTLTLPGRDDDTNFSVWPWIVREPSGAVIVGLLATRRTGYSGGGAMVSRLTLFRSDPSDRTIAELFDVPVEGSAMIRACFSEADGRARRDACHDEYAFGGALSLDPATASGRPRFVYESRAGTFPGHVSRSEDSSERPPLRRRDLVWWRDPTCSFRRSFAFDPAAGRYVPDHPLPDCEDYLDLG